MIINYNLSEYSYFLINPIIPFSKYTARYDNLV